MHIHIYLGPLATPAIEKHWHRSPTNCPFSWDADRRLRLDGQMQSQQQQQDALLPRPRGFLPRVCAALLVTLATGGLRFVSPEELLGWVALVTLMLTLGRLLHGLCLLAEEALHHHDTRWDDTPAERRAVSGGFNSNCWWPLNQSRTKWNNMNSSRKKQEVRLSHFLI